MFQIKNTFRIAFVLVWLFATSTQQVYPQQKPINYIAPAVLITAGFVGVYNTSFCDFKEDIKQNLADLRGDNYLHFDNYLQYAPITYFAIGDYIGTPSKHNINERVLLGCTAAIITFGLTQGIKSAVGEERPDTKAHTSFPSGHTATAFMGAELVRLSYGNWVGLGAYAVATGIGFLRMYNERHWLNDVLGGAGMGILSANIAHLLLPWEKSWFKHQKNDDISLHISPFYGPHNSIGINFVVTM